MNSDMFSLEDVHRLLNKYAGSSSSRRSRQQLNPNKPRFGAKAYRRFVVVNAKTRYNLRTRDTENIER